jgi:diguanylate cyclase (GGDEF)-like protein
VTTTELPLDRLPSLPAAALRILEALKDENINFGQLSKIIASDPALCSKLLAMANSPYYGAVGQVHSVDKAISVIGTNNIKNLALSFVIIRNMQGNNTAGFSFDSFWRRAITASVAAELFAQELSGKSDGRAAVSGLLQDIGILMLYYIHQEDYTRVFQVKEIQNIRLYEAEKAIFSIDHQAAGTEALKRWGLPEAVYTPISAHHNPSTLDQYQQDGFILQSADLVSAIYHGSNPLQKLPMLHNICGQQFGWDNGQIHNLLDKVAHNAKALLGFFNIDPANMKPYHEMLEEANEELRKLNVDHAQLILQLKRAKEKYRRVALQLKQANDKLRELSTRDGLTGLYNQRYFHDALNKELSRAARYKRAFSLIIFDIDKFKQINDTYGHLQGDLVLHEVARIIQSQCRNTDIVCRYGGDEFAIIMPETNTSNNAAIAMRIVKAVNSTKIKLSQDEITISISMGITTYIPNLENKNASDLIGAADKALYHSKQSGGNQLSMAVLTPPEKQCSPQPFKSIDQPRLAKVF